MSKLTPQKFNRLSHYIKMYEGDRETLQNAWANTWDDDSDDYYDLTDNDIQKTLSELRGIIDLEEYRLSLHKELLTECEKIYMEFIKLKSYGR